MDSSQGHVHASIYNEMPQSRWSTLTAPPILCELAQSNCTWTSQKAPFLREFAMNMPQTMTGTTGLKHTWTSQKAPFMREFEVTMKMPPTKTGTTVLQEPAQSKCTWTSQKGTFMQTKTMPYILCGPA
jgi:hypothetical protein